MGRGKSLLGWDVDSHYWGGMWKVIIGVEFGKSFLGCGRGKSLLGWDVESHYWGGMWKVIIGVGCGKS